MSYCLLFFPFFFSWVDDVLVALHTTHTSLCLVLPDQQQTLNDGDLVKLDIGCHIDGYIAVAAHTIQIGEGEITGVRADVVKATYQAAEVAATMIKAGNTNAQVTDAIKQVADDYGVNLVAGKIG